MTTTPAPTVPAPRPGGPADDPVGSLPDDRVAPDAAPAAPSAQPNSRPDDRVAPDAALAAPSAQPNSRPDDRVEPDTAPAVATWQADPWPLAVPSSQPYPWPYDGAVAADRTALLLVAVQEGLAPRCPGAAEALGVIATLTAAARAWGATVVATRHAASPAQRRPNVLPAPGDAGWELLAGQLPDAVVDAFGVDGFSGSPLAECLAGLDVDHLLICGLGLEGPVHSTMRSANDRGLECLLVIDGCAALDPTLADAGVRIIEMSGGIFGAVATGAAVLRALDPTRPAGGNGA